MRRLAPVLLVLFAAMAPAAGAESYPDFGGDFRLNLQAPQLAAELPASFQNGTPDTWTVTLSLDKGYADYDQGGEAPQRMGQASGTGQPASPIRIPVDPSWRWRWMTGGSRYIVLEWTWTEGGQTYQDRATGILLTTYTDEGKYSSLPMPGFYGLYEGENSISDAPGAWLTALGHAVSDRYDASSFRSGARLRKSVQLPWIAPWDGGPSVRVRVLYPKGRNPNFGIPVYATTLAVPDQPGATFTATAKLTRRGRRLVKRLGARKVAAKLGSRGVVDYQRQPVRSPDAQLIWVPIGTFLHDYQNPKSNPRAQTCEPFPGIPSGYLMYTTIDTVYGSDTCTKGDALTPIPLF